MNEDTSFQPLPESDDHHLEARIVAMILGEASDFEREQLLQLIAERPDLAEFHAQMMQTHGLLGAIDPAELDASEEMTVFASLALSDVEEAENESTLKSDPAWQLSDEKRLALLAVLSESSSQAVGDDSRSSVVTGSSGGPWWSRLKGRHYLVAAVSAGLLLSVGAAVVPMGLLRSPVMTASYWEAEDSIEDSMVEGMEADGIATDSYIAGFESGETRSAVAQTRSANRGENWEKAQQTVASNSLERLRESFESVTPQPPQLTPSPSRTPSRMGDLTAAGSGAGVGRSINGQDLAAGGASGPGAQPNPELWDSLSMQRSADTALPGGGDGRASMRDLGSTLNRNSQSGGSVDPNSLTQNSRDYFRFGGAYNSDSGGTDLSLPQVETPSDYGLAGAPRGKSNQTNFGNRWAEEKAKSSDLSLGAEGRFDDRFNKVASNGLAADFDTDLDGTDARTKWGLQTPSTQPELPTLSYSIPADKQSAYPKGVAPGNPVPSFAQGNPTHFYSQPQQAALEPSSGLAAGGLPAPTESAGPEAPDGGQAILGGVFVPNGRTMLNSDINGQTQLEGMFGANTSGGGRGGRAGMGGGGFGGGGGGDYGRGDGGRGSAVAASRGRGIVDAETGVADAPVLDSLKDFSGVPSPQTPRPTVANELPPTNAPHMMEESRKLAESEPAGEITMDGEALAKRESRSRFEAMNGAKAPTRNFRRSQMGRDRSVEFDVAETAEAATRENLFDEAQAGRQQQGQGQAQAGQRALGLETMIADQDQLGTETFRYKEGKLQLGQGLAAKSEEKNVAGAEIQLTRPDVTLADDMVAELEVDELEALIVSPGTESAAALGDLAPQQKMAKAGEVLAVREAQQQISKSLAELSQLNQQIAQANDDFLQIAPQQTPAKKRTLEGESLARKDSLEEQEMEEALLDQEDDSKADEKKDASRMPIAGKPLAARPGLEETLTETEAFSTFSLHVSDVSFKVVQSLLQQQQWPTPDQVRIEEFVNALDYHDPLPSIDDKVACQIEQGVHPFLQQRNLMRVSMRTAATGRANGVPLRLTLLLDNSGSMDRMDRRETVVRAFDTLTQQLGPNDQITLIRFANRPHLVRDRLKGDEAAQLVPLVRDLPSEGGTNFETALELAYQKAQEQFAPAAQNRVILLTDGAVNLGDADPERLARKITDMRDVGIAFDAAGISARDLNDEVLESLTRKGDGRYYLLDSVESVSDGFSQQIAGALRPAAKNVKVQVEFNPQRVRRYKLLGFEKHRLNKEDFRNDKVDAAEMAAAEAGVAVYQFEALPDGIGDVGSVSVRFQDLSTGRMVERRWPIPYDPNTARIESANPELQMATVASLLAAKLKGDALGDSVELDQLGQFLSTLPPSYGESLRVQQLQQMIRDARNISNR